MNAYKSNDWDKAYGKAYKKYMLMGYGTLISTELARAVAHEKTGKEG